MNAVSVLTGSTGYPVRSAADLAATTDPAAFQGWPEAVKLRFVQANGSGTPPALVIGPAGGSQVLATVSADGFALSTSQIPADFDAAPAALAPATFSNWSTDLQLFYLAREAPAGGGITVGSGAGAIDVAPSPGGDAVVVSGGEALDRAYAPVLADPAYAPASGFVPPHFFDWPPDVQYSYYLKYRDDGLQLAFADPAAGGIPVTLDFGGARYTVVADPAQLAAARVDPAALLAGPGQANAPTPAIFASWPRELQRAYVLAFAERAASGTVAYPATVLVQGGGQTVVATVAGAGAGLDALSVPGFGAALAAPAPVTLDTFTGWPEAAQLAYARAKLASGRQSLALVSASSAGAATATTLTVTRDTGAASGIALTPSLGSPAQLADLAVLHLLTPVQLQTYLARNGTGTPPAVVLAQGANLFVVTASATVAPPSVTMQTLPGETTRAPGLLDALTFASWTLEVQSYYFGLNAVGTPPSLLLGSASGGKLLTPSTDATDPGYAVADLPSGYDKAPAQMAPADMSGWSAAALAHYVAVNAAGTPPVVILGPAAAPTGLVSPPADPSASGLLVQALPGAFTTAPASLNAATYMGWTPEVRSAYFASQATGTPATLRIRSSAGDPAAGALVVSRDAANPYGLDATVQLGAAPIREDAALFMGLSSGEVTAWLVRNGTGSPKSLVVGTSLVTASVDPAGGPAVQPLPGGFTSAPTSISAATVRGFTPEARARYLADHLQPSADLAAAAFFKAMVPAAQARYLVDHPQAAVPFVAVGTAPQLVLLTIAASGRGADIQDLPTAAASGPSAVTAATFQSWTPQAQAFYMAGNGVGVPPILLLANKMLVTATTAGGYAAETAPTGIDRSPDASSNPTLSWADFIGWSSDTARTYFADRYGFGTPPMLALKGDTGSVLVTQATDSTGTSAYKQQALPSAALGAATSVTLAVIQAWPSDVQRFFVAKNSTVPKTVSGAPKALTIVSGAATYLISDPFYPATIGTQIQKLPAAYSNGPSTIALSDFTQWTREAQADYIARRSGAIVLKGGETVTLADLSAPLAIPYYDLTGGASGLDTTSGSAATTLFPVYDGVVYRMSPKPAGFDLAPAALPASTFRQWSSAIQLEYIANNQPGTAALTIGHDVATPQNPAIDVFSGGPKSPAGYSTRVYVAQDLQKQDIAKMSLADQQTLAAIPAFNGSGLAAKASLAYGLGLIPDGVAAATSSAAKAQIDGLFTDATTRINHPTQAIPGGPAALTVDGQVPAADQAIFTQELDNIKAEVATSAIFSPNDINQQISVILDRYARANAFSYSVNGDGKASTVSPSSMDGGVSFRQSYNTIIQQENIILTAQNNGLKLARQGQITDANGNAIGSKLDLPSLIYYFQLFANLAGEARIRADTEEVNQTNNLLKMYGLMQQVINATVASFNGDDTKNNTAKGLATSPDAATQAQWALAEQIFGQKRDSGTKDKDGNIVYVQRPEILSPIEILKGISRPYDKMDGRDSTQWQQFGTQLSDAVTLINQDSQLKMNDINTETKQKDRNFDLANSALSKMYDTLQKILSAS